MGSTDLAFGMITGGNWFKVPETIKVELTGKPGKHIYGKDIILELIRMIGVDGALYKAIEFTGEAVQYLGMADRFSIANMVIEAGAKNGVFAVDEVTEKYLAERAEENGGLRAEPKIHYADEDAVYCQTLTIDTAALSPVVAYPFLPENGKPIETAVADDLKIDQVMIGSCTNGRIEDLRVAAEIVKGKRVAKHTRMIVTPGTQKILLQAQKEGLMEILIEAGAVVSNPTCGACLGGYMGILGDGERCVATTNRNFVGRMGARTSEIYLANSAVAAASAIAGKIVDPRDI
jgi:3-isopropylmalate/(R)-2-methylmalate dehydratase large subunit